MILTSAVDADPLPALALLPHRITRIPAVPSALVDAPECDVIVVDGTHDLVAAKSLCSLLHATGLTTPLLLALTEGGMAAVSADWGVDDIVRAAAGPAEIDARIRLAAGRRREDDTAAAIRSSGIVIDEANYSAKVQGRRLDLTFKEFELLRFLASHPARVFTREQLLDEVWGDDYFGGTRTVDVHVRRLRAKLGEMESLIGTVRGVGYRFDLMEDDGEPVSATVAG